MLENSPKGLEGLRNRRTNNLLCTGNNAQLRYLEQ